MINNIENPYTGDYCKDYVHLLDNFPRIRVGKDKRIKITKHIDDLIEAKSTETAHIKDNKSTYKRHLNGILAEGGVENFLEMGFINYTISHSKNHDVPDLSSIGINVGVKSCEYGKYPLIDKSCIYPQIILIKEQTEDWFWICGVFDAHILRKYSTRYLVNDSNIKDNKEGFYALDQGNQFKNIDELKRLVG